jgi:hypothetical protein
MNIIWSYGAHDPSSSKYHAQNITKYQVRYLPRSSRSSQTSY